MRRISSLIPLLLLFPAISCTAGQEQPKNLILFIADGCGPATYSLGREHIQATEGRPLVFDSIEVGSVNTRASNSRVTDSAASATAYACGVRTRNGMIGVSPDTVSVPTILEAAEAAGLWTGLVSTARITHATPAAFSAHVASRSDEAEIASQQIEQGIEVLLGGGATYYAGPGGRSSRSDGRDLFAEAEEAGYQILEDREALMEAESVPVLGLFDPTHMDYEVDREEQPSLAEMTSRALELLEDAPEGFFIMIEAGRIDHAGHANDIGAHLHDFLAYEKAVAAALEFAEAEGHTLVVATSDHETGGLSLGADGRYNFDPATAAAMTRSHEDAVDAAGESAAAGVRGNGLAGVLANIVRQGNLGSVQAEATDALAAISAQVDGAEDPVIFVRAQFDGFLRQHTANAAGIGWSTSGHTGVNVPLFAHGPGSNSIGGTLDNHVLGQRLAAALGLEFSMEAPVN